MGLFEPSNNGLSDMVFTVLGALAHWTYPELNFIGRISRFNRFCIKPVFATDKPMDFQINNR